MNEQELSVLRGCRDMLREAAKQFRLQASPGHAVMCDRHAELADTAVSNHFRQLQEQYPESDHGGEPNPRPASRSEADPFEPQ